MNKNITVKQFFNKYQTQTISFPTTEVDAVLGFFQKRGVSPVGASSITALLLTQARTDNVSVFSLLDSLKDLSFDQINELITMILNSTRSNISSYGYKTVNKVETLISRDLF